MKDHARNRKESIPELRGKKRRLLQALTILSAIAGQLEPARLRECDEEMLLNFIEQVETVRKDIRELPSKKSPVQDLKRELFCILEEALIELLVAREQFTAEGRTRKFYESLSQFRHYIESALEHGQEYQEQIAWVETPEPLEDEREVMLDVQSGAVDLARSMHFSVQQLLREKDELSGRRYMHLKEALRTLQEPLESLRALFNERVSISEESAQLLYQLQILLNNIDQQVERLVALLPVYRVSEDNSLGSALVVNKEISRKIEVIYRRCNELLQVIDALLEQGDLRSGRRRLYSIK